MTYTYIDNFNLPASCVFSKRKSAETVIVFSETILENAKQVLEILKTYNNIKYKDIVLPVGVSPVNVFHSRWYRNFTALMPKYKKCVYVNKTSLGKLQNWIAKISLSNS